MMKRVNTALKVKFNLEIPDEHAKFTLGGIVEYEMNLLRGSI